MDLFFQVVDSKGGWGIFLALTYLSLDPLLQALTRRAALRLLTAI
jgi:hypothetical protein